jgi:MFS family permease
MKWLINRNFTLLSIGQAISNIGDFVYSTTLLIWVYSLGGSAAAVSGVLVAQYVPNFLVGPLAGVFVDRWNRLRTMLTSDLLRAAIALLPIFAPGELRIPVIYLSVFFLSSVACFFGPSRTGLIQVLVADEELGQAASIGQVGLSLAFVIGPALASPLYFLVGPITAVSINAASYVVSAFCLWRIRVPAADLSPSAMRARTGELAQTETPGGLKAIVQELRIGFSFVFKTRVLLVITLLILIAMFGGGMINALDIVFVKQRLHTSPDFYGYLTATSGAGMLVGSICAGLLAKRIQARYMLVGSMILLGGFLVIYSLQTWFALALVFSFLLSFTNGGLEVGVAPLMMLNTPRHLMGRVMAVINTTSSGASLISIGLAGVLGSFIPVYLLLLIGGVLVALSGVFGWLALPAPAPATPEEISSVDGPLAVAVDIERRDTVPL